LAAGINPAWRDRIERFAELLQPLLTAPGTLTRADWKTIRTRFSSYAGALANKPVPAKPPVVFAPTKTPDSLGTERIDVILSSGVMEKFKKLAEEDARMPAAASDIAAVERLYRYYRHLYRLLLNFVSFEDFYTQRRTASFQSGSLLIDGRACHLCMPAVNIDEHAAMAARSQLFLLYCKCSRGVKPGTTEPAETRNIVAAVTSGDSDLLLESRNGVFVDNLGEDWDAKVVKVVSNPIGLWEAIWSPYKRFGNMVTDAISKYANEKQAGLMASATKTIDQIGTTSGAPPTFDMSKNIGIFAAVGIALGAIGTALGSLASAFFAMAWWQFPLIFIGLFLLISGPSVLMAWLKLRQRTLGPLLEASGWAVNGKMALNYTMATKLTRMGELPENVTLESGLDVERIKRLDRKVFWYAVLIGAALALAISLYVVHRNAVNRAVRAVDGASTHQVRESARQAVEELARSLKSASHFAETPAAAPAAAAAAQSAAEAPAPASTPSPAPAPEPTPPPAPDPAPAPVAAEPAPPPAT
ncbi:MAG: hypothetical protein LIP23_00310, partial [Planctomycetes bacterium]|nr:hypothetical protein [Planctomycetota bacterium]